MAPSEEEVFLMAALSGNAILKLVKLSARPVHEASRPVEYTNIRVVDDGGSDYPDGVYDVHVIGLEPMKVWRLNGYWLPVELQ